MKKIRTWLFCLILVCSVHNISAQAAVVVAGGQIFDPTNWLSALDQVYSAYDQIMKTVTMIEQNYEQLQYYYDRARKFKFEEIQWDGDLDFRNEIRNATGQVNRQLTNIRKMKETYTKKIIRVGNASYSITDLLGIGDEGKSIESFAKDTMNFVENTYEKAARGFEEGLTDSEASFLWSRYGLSPANYYMVQGVKSQADQAFAAVFANSDEEAIEEKDRDYYEAISNIMDMASQEGLTPDEMEQIGILMDQQNIYALKSIERTIADSATAYAYNVALQNQKEEAEQQSYLEMTAAMNKESFKLPGNF